jgi:predicted small secreted protein
MSLKKTAALLLVLCGTLLAACRANQSLEGQARDAKLATEIKSRIASRVGASTITSIEVNVTNGVVTLAGPVHSQQESQQIESAARGVEGVTDVKNAMQILGQEVTTPAAAAAPASGLAVTPAPPTPAR